MAMWMQHVATLPIDHIDVPKGRRPIDPKTVETLVNSIKEIGLQNPITVRHGDNRHILVAGLHRLEALRKLGRDRAPCLVVDMSDVDARLWEIAENLHRSDLTAQERAEQIAQWVRLTEQKGVSAQLAPKPVLHDIRRSVATRMADLGVQPHIIEAVLNHQSGHKAGIAGVYNRSPYEREVRNALAMWHDHLRSLIEGGERKVLNFQQPQAAP